MPRAVWSGSVNVGLVHVPVQLFPATRDRSVRFHQVDRETGSRVRTRRVSEESGEELPRERIAKGYELEPGRHVLVEDDEIDALRPEGSRVLELERFVDLADVDPVYFDRTYYLGPGTEAGTTAYALLRDALHRSGRAGVGRLIMRGRERLVALRATGPAIALEVLHFADEVAEPGESAGPAAGVQVGERELDAAIRLVDSLVDEWKPEAFSDVYREELLALVERKAAGEEILGQPTEAEPEGAEVVDLMDALERSIARQKSTETKAEPAASNGKALEKESPGDVEDDGLASRSKSELYELARDAGISGRSGMSKEDLVAALRGSRTAETA